MLHFYSTGTQQYAMWGPLLHLTSQSLRQLNPFLKNPKTFVKKLSQSIFGSVLSILRHFSMWDPCPTNTIDYKRT